MALVKRETTAEQRAASIGAKQRETPFLIVSLILGALSFIGMMVSIWAIFLYAPTDAIQGQPQRIFYFHVPMAWVALLASGVLAVTSIVYLWKRDERWDYAARASDELGAVFTTLALITRSL